MEEGEIIALIGANGAGKTTTLHTISGLLSPHAGSIRFYGQRDHPGCPPKIVKMGIAQVPEGRRIFANLSVYNNLRMGAYTRKDKEEFERNLETVYASFPILKERREQMGGTLSGGEQQMLAMGRALMSSPRLMIMDEPSMGLAPILVEQIFKTHPGNLHSAGTTILLVEQNAQMALSVANRGYVLETYRDPERAPSADLLENKAVQAAYLGG